MMTGSSLLFVAVLLAAVVLLVRYLAKDREENLSAARSGPERVLAERFARGEIDEEDYRRRLETLRGAD